MILPTQFGFKAHPAAAYQEANLVQAAAEHCGPRKEVVAILLDIEKAYDKV